MTYNLSVEKIDKNWPNNNSARLTIIDNTTKTLYWCIEFDLPINNKTSSIELLQEFHKIISSPNSFGTIQTKKSTIDKTLARNLNNVYNNIIHHAKLIDEAWLPNPHLSTFKNHDWLYNVLKKNNFEQEKHLLFFSLVDQFISAMNKIKNNW